MIDRYLNDELRESMSANQKDLIEKLMAQPYEERSIEERREMYEQYEKMLKERDEAESKAKEDEFTKMGYPEHAVQRPNYTPPSRIDKKKKKAKRRQQKQSRRKR